MAGLTLRIYIVEANKVIMSQDLCTTNKNTMCNSATTDTFKIKLQSDREPNQHVKKTKRTCHRQGVDTLALALVLTLKKLNFFYKVWELLNPVLLYEHGPYVVKNTCSKSIQKKKTLKDKEINFTARVIQLVPYRRPP